MTILPDTVLGLSIGTWLFKVGPLAAMTYTALWIIYAVTLHPLAKVPGPFWASVTRLWYMYQVKTGHMDRIQRELHKQYGSVVRIAPNEVTSSNAADIPQIYRLNDPLLKTDFYPLWGVSGAKTPAEYRYSNSTDSICARLGSPDLKAARSVHLHRRERTHSLPKDRCACILARQRAETRRIHWKMHCPLPRTHERVCG